MFVSWYQMYNDSPKEMTATQTEIDDQRGRTAFLALMSNTLDDIQNDVTFLFNQIMRPNEPSIWRETHIERSKHFKPISPLDLANKQLAVMEGWSNLGYGRRVQLEQAGYGEEEIDEIIKIDSESLGEEAVEL